MQSLTAEGARPDFDPVASRIDILAPDHTERLREALDENGFAVFGGITSPQQFLGVAEEIGTPRRYVQTDENGVTTLSSLEATKGIGQAGKFEVDHELQPHTDGCAMSEPAQFLMLYCVQPDTLGGGESMLVDGKKVYERMIQQNPELLERLQTPDSVVFGPKDKPEKQLRTSIISVEDDGLVSFRLRRDGEAWYVDQDGVLKPLSELDEELKPFYDLVEEEMTKFTLQPGQGFIVNNRRMLHGRTKIQGEREVKRVQLDVPQDPWLNFAGRGLPKGFYMGA